MRLHGYPSTDILHLDVLSFLMGLSFFMPKGHMWPFDIHDSLHATPGKLLKCSNGFPLGDILCLGKVNAALRICFSWQVSFTKQDATLPIGEARHPFFPSTVCTCIQICTCTTNIHSSTFHRNCINVQATCSHAGSIYRADWPHIIYRRSISCCLYSVFVFSHQNE